MMLVGRTECGKPILANVFVMYGTHGLPLEIILGYFKDNDFVVDWPSYICDALAEGHNLKTVQARILAAVADVYGKPYITHFSERLDEWMLHIKS